MSHFLDCNGIPLTVGDVCIIVKSDYRYTKFVGTIVVIKNLLTDPAQAEHDELGNSGCYATITPFLMKLQDLDDDEVLKNNVLFNTTDTWERITDYPAKPKLEPELV